MAETDDRIERELAAVHDREALVAAWTTRRSDDEIVDLVQCATGPLAGWTIGVKDVIDTADFSTERGSPIHAGRRPSVDAACVAQLQAAGAVVAGKTVTTEFALFAAAGTTNPHDPTRSPGGSSSGSAAAVAAGMCRAALGTQTVGSVLRPAAYCGVVGFKPTYHLIPPTGVATLAHSLDTVGWFTNDVADATDLLETFVGPDDTTRSEPGRSPRVGLYRSAQWASAQAETAVALASVADRLATAGADVVEVDEADHLAPVFAAGDVILHFEALRALAPERQRPELIHPLISRMFERAQSVTSIAYGAAQRSVALARHQHDAWLDEFGLDVLLTPASPGVAPELGTTGDSVFNRTWSTLGIPAISLPAGAGPGGLPLGVQLCGRRWGDHRLLEAAAWVEQALQPGIESE